LLSRSIRTRSVDWLRVAVPRKLEERSSRPVYRCTRFRVPPQISKMSLLSKKSDGMSFHGNHESVAILAFLALICRVFVRPVAQVVLDFCSLTRALSGVAISEVVHERREMTPVVVPVNLPAFAQQVQSVIPRRSA